MNSVTMKNGVRMVAACFLACCIAGAGANVAAFTNMHGGGGGFHGGGFQGAGFHGGGARYGGFHGYGWSGGFRHSHYWGGFYIGDAWFWGPTIVVAGIPYYYYSGVYYAPYGDALVAVSPPVSDPAAVVSGPGTSTEAAPAKVEPKATKPAGETVTINVPNVGGGYTPIKLVKIDKGYVGPQGEFYANHPTVDQLKVLYGE